MTIPAYEGIVENGRIRLRDNVTLPENTRVYVVIPGIEATTTKYIYTPRLVHPEQSGDFAKEVLKAADDAGL